MIIGFSYDHIESETITVQRVRGVFVEESYNIPASVPLAMTFSIIQI